MVFLSNISVTQFQDVILGPYSLSKPVLRKRYLSKSTLQTKRQDDVLT
jgi:hypothetical protein